VDGKPLLATFSSMKFFYHEPSIDPSSTTRWMRLIGEAGAERLLKETIQTELKSLEIKPYQLKRVNIDTIMQGIEVWFPIDARQYDRARKRIVKFGKERGIRFRQNYNYHSKQTPG
jgi:IS5 family transposase